MDTDLELQNIDNFIEERIINISYPHVLIEGVTTEEEIVYFHKKFVEDSKAVPLYVKFEEAYQCIGKFSLTLDNLLVVRSIDDYKLKLVVADDKVFSIDMNEPDALLRFITLCE